MSFVATVNRWRDSLARRTAARDLYEAIIYFDSPHTKWRRSRQDWTYEQHPGGLRVVLCDLGEQMPEPDPDDILQRRKFRSSVDARLWVTIRLHGFDTSKVVGEVRSL